LGYRNLRSFPLIVEFAGQPFVDFRVSANSLIPASLDEGMASRLVDAYIKYLSKNPYFHDKVEFEVILSHSIPDGNSFLEKFDAFSGDEIRIILESLNKLTRELIIKGEYGLSNITQKNHPLQPRREEIVNSSLPTIAKIYWLVEDCKRYGTLPFAGAARLAFVATGILRRFVEIGTIDNQNLSRFYQSISTPASDMATDRMHLTHSEFIEKYGHLRPGTFDILLDTYRDNFEAYFPNEVKRLEPASIAPHGVDPKTELSSQLATSPFWEELGVEVEEFLEFSYASIHARESIKFEFSKNVSLILDEIKNLGKELGYTKQDLSFADISVFLKSYRESSNFRDELESSIKSGKKKQLIRNSVKFPYLIVNPTDVFFFEVYNSIPNFITNSQVVGEVAYLPGDSRNLTGRVVLIESADPGYDWIFSQSIAGLITAFGGANSHMAIRCLELGVPAAIGVGEVTFKSLSQSSTISLDCLSKLVKIVH
jgi:phosphohistidine swiveling domain-containing protein